MNKKIFDKKEEPLEIDRETWEKLREFRKTGFKEKYKEIKNYSEL